MDSKPHRAEPLFSVFVSILLMVSLQIVITDRLTLGPKYFLAILELTLLLGAFLAHSSGKKSLHLVKRYFSFLLLMVVTAANIGSLVLVVKELVKGGPVPGHTLLLSALAIYLTNILIFGLWYWEMDSPGLTGFIEPASGPDFLFPQMTARDVHPACKTFTPLFLDYLYISITNASAFSPTDSLPLTHRAKVFMSIQSLTSLVTVALVAARAVNILS